MTKTHRYIVIRLMNDLHLPVLRKPTGTIQLSNPFNHGERKLLNTLMYHAQVDGCLSGDEHDIALDDVLEAIGWKKSKNIDELKAHLKTLLSTVIEWNEFGEDKASIWTACQFLSSGKIARGRLRYMVNPKIVAELNSPILYAKVQLLVQGKLTKKHSLVLYEYFQDTLGRKAKIEKLPIEFLLNLLGLSGETYTEYKYFQRDVLKPSIKEINTLTDLSVSYTPVRKGRKTIALDFKVEREETFQLSFDLTPRRAPLSSSIGTMDSLLRNGINEKIAISLCEKYSDERLKGNIEHLRNELDRGQIIKNRGAWLRRAVEQDWRPVKSVEELKDEKAAQTSANAREQKKQANIDQKILETEFATFQSKRAREIFASRSKTFQTRRHNLFLESMREENNYIVLREFQKKGWDSVIVQAHFIAGKLLGDLLTEKHETSLEAFAAWKGSQSSI